MHRSPVNSKPVTQRFDVIIDLRLESNSREAGDLRRHRPHYDVIVMQKIDVYMMLMKWASQAEESRMAWWYNISYNIILCQHGVMIVSSLRHVSSNIIRTPWAPGVRMYIDMHITQYTMASWHGSVIRITGLFEGKPPVISWLPSQRASNAVRCCFICSEINNLLNIHSSWRWFETLI